MQTINARMNLLEWSLLLLLAVIWGSSFFFMEIILEDLTPFQLVFYRLFLGAIFLWGVVFVKKLVKFQHLKLYKEFLILGFINNALPFSLIAIAQTTINSSLASILNATVPFFAALFAYLMLHDEKLSLGKLSGLVIGFMGVIVIIGLGVFTNFTQGHQAMLFMIVATTSYGLGIVYSRRFKSYDIRPMFLATIQLTMATLWLALVLLIRGESFLIPLNSSSVVLSILSLSIVGTGLAYIVFFYIIESAGAVNASLTTFLVPVIAITLGVVFLDEVLLINHIIGFIIILIGLVVIDGRALQIIKI